MMKKSHKITEPYAQIPTFFAFLTGSIFFLCHKITEPYAQIPTFIVACSKLTSDVTK